MTSMEIDDEMMNEEGKGLSQNEVNGNQDVHDDCATSGGEGTKQTLSSVNGSTGVVANGDCNSNNATLSPSRKRIRLSLKGKPVATVAVLSSNEDPATTTNDLIPPPPTTGDGNKEEEKAASSNSKAKSLVGKTPGKTESSAGVAQLEETSSSPPKKKIKLEMDDTKNKSEVKEPPSRPHDPDIEPLLDRNGTGGTKASAASADAPEAMVLEHGADGEDDAVAAVVEEPAKPKKPTKLKIVAAPAKLAPTHVSSQHSTLLHKKGRNAAALRAIRIPPMSSPGLLIAPGIYRGPVDANGLVSPNAVFSDAMNAAGYNVKSRTDDPHRGSSVQRVVDDMYDSNVKLCLRYPQLVPLRFLKAEDHSNATVAGETSSVPQEVTCENPTDSTPATATNGEPGPKPTKRPSVAERLVNALTLRTENTVESSQKTAQQRGKRSRVRAFYDMVPVSLTLPYPEEYISKRLEYVELVNQREKAVIARQKEEEEIEILREKYEAVGDEYEDAPQPIVAVPPIPVPPDPPKLSEMEGINKELFCQEEHPIYKPKEDLVEHLDKRCFHIIDGRYFGLTSAALADQHFVGPNAPGIGGLHLSSVSGLATFTASGSANNGVPLFDPPSALAGPKNSVALGIVSAKSSVKNVKSGMKSTSSEVKKQHPVPITSQGKPSSNSKGDKGKTSTAKFGSTMTNGPSVTASRHQLKLVMEAGGEEAEKMKTVIIKAAVYAVRLGKPVDRSFRAFDRKVYPDAAKAFSSFSGLKPCAKCKGNKQGTFHCRLRRKHQEMDFDGGDSWKTLEPYFEVTLTDLLIKPKKKEDSTTKTSGTTGS